MKKQYTLLISLLLILVSLFVQGCDTTPQGPGENTGDPVDTTPVVQDLAIVENGSTQYTLVTSEFASDKTSESVRKILDAFNSTTGVKPQWTDDYLDPKDPVPAKEILVGITCREESLAIMQDVRYGEYVIRTVDDKIVIAAWDEESLADACSKFANYIKRSGTQGTLTLPGDYVQQDVGLEVLLQMPHYGAEDEAVQFIDLADASYMLLAEDTDLAEFEAYYSVLEAAGYTCFSKRQMANNHYAVYTNEEKIIHASFTASKRDARITIDNAYDMSIFTETEYEKVCEPSVTLVGLEGYGGIDGTKPGTRYGNPIGLLMIFRMEDGRFVVVDGGGLATETISLIYDNLYELAVDKDNIVIAAWILTHAHGDHVGGFSMFSGSSRKDKVTVQNFIHHFCTTQQYNNCKDHGRAAEARQLMRTYKGANIIKAHAGQLLKIGGAEIEVLCTSGDLEPYTLQDHNTSSVVFRVTAAGNSVLVLGDASYITNSYLVKEYGDYLKSDMVQLAHHGYAGGTVLLYETVDAEVVLWPGGVGGFDGGLEPQDLRYRDANARAIELAEEVYVAGEAVHTLIMPYTPEEVEITKIIK